MITCIANPHIIKQYLAAPAAPVLGPAPAKQTTTQPSVKQEKVDDQDYPFQKGSTQCHAHEMYSKGGLGNGWRFWYIDTFIDSNGNQMNMAEHVGVKDYHLGEFLLEREDVNGWTDFLWAKTPGEWCRALARLHDADQYVFERSISGKLHVFDTTGNYKGNLKLYRHNWCLQNGLADH